LGVREKKNPLTLNDPKRGENNIMTGVIVRPGESFEKALRRFTKTCEKAGILSDVKKKQRHEKPSEERKRRLNQAVRRALKERTEAR
jgi:small subunit ribosomal protein S21